MIREYFLTNNLFYITHIKLDKKYLLVQIKSCIKIPKYYYIYLFNYLYNIFPYSVNIKMTDNYYKLITLKYFI